MAIVALALGIRLVHLWQLSASPYWSVLMGDAVAYDRWALRLSRGEWLPSTVFYQAPLYPYVLGILYWLVGRNLMIVRLAQAVVGSVSCGLLCLAGSMWFDRRVGIVSGIVLACYGPALFFDSVLQKSVLDLWLTCGLLCVLALIAMHASIARAALLGVTLGALALTRENALVFVPVVIAWLIVRRDRPFACSTAVVAGALLLLAPVAIHNHRAGGGWTLTTSQSGPNLFIGNSEVATGTYVTLRRGRGNADFEQRDATELAAAAAGSTLGPGEVSNYWRERALLWISAHPWQWVKLTAFKCLLLLNRAEASDTEDVASYAEWSWPLRGSAPVFNFGILAPLAAIGIWLTRDRWKRLWILYALSIAYAIGVVVFYVLGRYRYPLVPFAALFAAAAIAEFSGWWRRSRTRERIGALGACAVVAVVCNWPIVLLSVNNAKGITHYNLGAAYDDLGRVDDAVVEYRTAAAFLPSNADIRSNLGLALAAKGEQDAALREYEEAIRLDPEFAGARNNLGMALAQSGRYADAIAQFDKAIALNPSSAEAHYNRGTALAAAGQQAAAIDAMAEALRLDPDNAAAHNNMGILLASTGRVALAIDHFKAALRLQPDFADARRNLARAERLLDSRR